MPFSFIKPRKLQPWESGYSARIPRSQWAGAESFIRALHSQGETRDGICDRLARERNFHPTSAQLQTQLQRWGLYRYKSRRSLLSATETGRPNKSQSTNQQNGGDKDIALNRAPLLITIVPPPTQVLCTCVMKIIRNEATRYAIETLLRSSEVSKKEKLFQIIYSVCVGNDSDLDSPAAPKDQVDVMIGDTRLCTISRPAAISAIAKIMVDITDQFVDFYNLHAYWNQMQQPTFTGNLEQRFLSKHFDILSSQNGRYQRDPTRSLPTTQPLFNTIVTPGPVQINQQLTHDSDLDAQWFNSHPPYSHTEPEKLPSHSRLPTTNDPPFSRELNISDESFKRFVCQSEPGSTTSPLTEHARANSINASFHHIGHSGLTSNQCSSTQRHIPNGGEPSIPSEPLQFTPSLLAIYHAPFSNHDSDNILSDSDSTVFSHIQTSCRTDSISTLENSQSKYTSATSFSPEPDILAMSYDHEYYDDNNNDDDDDVSYDKRFWRTMK